MGYVSRVYNEGIAQVGWVFSGKRGVEPDSISSLVGRDRAETNSFQLGVHGNEAQLAS